MVHHKLVSMSNCNEIWCIGGETVNGKLMDSIFRITYSFVKDKLQKLNITVLQSTANFYMIPKVKGHVAHEFNNDLFIIGGEVEKRKELQLFAETREDAEKEEDQTTPNDDDGANNETSQIIITPEVIEEYNAVNSAQDWNIIQNCTGFTPNETSLPVFMSKILSEGLYSDFTIYFKGESYKVHRAILFARCPKLLEQSDFDFDASSIAFGQFLSFLYTCSFKLPNHINTVQFLNLAKQLECKSFKVLEQVASIQFQNLNLSHLIYQEYISDFKALLVSKQYSDFTVECNSEELTSFSVHKLFLAQINLMSQMIQGNFLEAKEQKIVFGQLSKSACETLVHYLYTHSLENVNIYNAVELHSFAQVYQVSNIDKYCLKVIEDELELDNVVDLLDISINNYEDLAKICLVFIKKSVLADEITLEWLEEQECSVQTKKLLYFEILEMLSKSAQSEKKEQLRAKSKQLHDEMMEKKFINDGITHKFRVWKRHKRRHKKHKKWVKWRREIREFCCNLRGNKVVAIVY